MKSQIITALSVIAVLGAAGGAFAANQSVLTSASSEPSVIGTATPVLVPIAPKGADIPEEYRQRLADAANGTLPGQGVSGLGSASTGTPDAVAPAQPAPSADGSSGGSGAYSDDDDDDDEYEDEDEDHEDESHEAEDESDDDD